MACFPSYRRKDGHFEKKWRKREKSGTAETNLLSGALFIKANSTYKESITHNVQFHGKVTFAFLQGHPCLHH